MNEPIYLFRCERCGKSHGTKIMEVTLKGNESDHIFEFKTCDACFKKTVGELDRVRPVFEAMQAANIPGEIANETMTFLLNKLYFDAEGKHNDQ